MTFFGLKFFLLERNTKGNVWKRFKTTDNALEKKQRSVEKKIDFEKSYMSLWVLTLKNEGKIANSAQFFFSFQREKELKRKKKL